MPEKFENMHGVATEILDRTTSILGPIFVYGTCFDLLSQTKERANYQTTL